MRYVKIVSVLIITYLCCRPVLSYSFYEGWNTQKGKHFIVYYPDEVNRQEARLILNESEKYYQTIGQLIGFSRYANFWTWEERVKIFVFKDHATFVNVTHQPSWSTGFADRDKHLFSSRAIVTYYQEEDLYNGILPHEIAHLMVQDFLGSQHTVPIWFQEGIAQYREGNKRLVADRMMRRLVNQKQFIRFAALMYWDIRTENDPVKVQIYYAQSVSIVDFLIEQYGRDAFAQLCRGLRAGKDFEQALGVAYTNIVSSVSDLEDKWVAHLTR